MSRKIIFAVPMKGVLLAAVVVSLFVLQGCGKKSPLEAPPRAQASEDRTG